MKINPCLFFHIKSIYYFYALCYKEREKGVLLLEKQDEIKNYLKRGLCDCYKSAQKFSTTTTERVLKKKEFIICV